MGINLFDISGEWVRLTRKAEVSEREAGEGGERFMYYVSAIQSTCFVGFTISTSEHRHIGEIIKITTAAVMALGIALAFLLSGRLLKRLIISPLKKLVVAMRGVKRGDYDVTVAHKGKDEIKLVIDVFNNMIQGLRERELIKDAFGKYVSRDIADKVLAGEVELGGRRRG